jgi:hypothetical protein
MLKTRTNFLPTGNHISQVKDLTSFCSFLPRLIDCKDEA